MLFLDSPSINKLRLFNYLLFHYQTATYEELLVELDVSKQTLHRYLTELQQDLNLTFSDHKLVLEKEKGLVVLKIDEPYRFPFFIDSLHLAYIKKSTDFTLIRTLIQKKYTTVTQLADSFYSSKSTIYRQLQRVESIFKKFNITLTFTSKNGDINLVFEEKDLRLFLYYFFWYTYKGLEWPFLKTTKERYKEMTKDLDLPIPSPSLLSLTNQFDYLLVLTFWRSLRRKHPIMIEPNIKKILSVFQEVNDLASFFDSFASEIDPDSLLNEKLFFNLILRENFAKVDSPVEVSQMAQKLSLIDDPLISHSQALVTETMAHFKIEMTGSEKDYYLYQFVLFYLYVFYLKIDFPSVITTYTENTLFSESALNPEGFSSLEVDNFLVNFRKEYPIPVKYHTMEHFLTSLLINARKKKSLTICLHFSINVLGERIIESQLLAVFNPDKLTFTHNPDEADLIISDCFQLESATTDFFYLERVTDIVVWKELVNYIQDKVFRISFSL